MDNTTAYRLLETMITFFESGTKESDTSAKAIIEWDFDHLEYWQKEIKCLQDEGEWTGLRAPEAEMITGILRNIQRELIQKQ